ncbi:enoyl-CoA hydratase/isomerase family protein [candidate division CSSED10-310 bacterium]|uniref:Enoyl-CoA hydratase/isomerase family protein n=1 Tax=candidate division CSSED10-310 bacterium TaxID=2855610 RepID=A0ABV6YU31_UNCC1
MEYETLLIEKKDKYAIVTINRPKVLNALNARVIDELHHVFDALKSDDSVLGVILTGAGKAFIAGADISELAKLSGFEAYEVALRGQDLLNKIEQLQKPVIAAVNGFALGGGCELAMACTFRIASEKAKLGQPEVKLGLVPGYGGTQRLTRLVGKGRAMELVLVGDPIRATEAAQIGLVNRVVPPEDLLATCESIMSNITARAPKAISYSLQAINHGLEMTLTEGLRLEANLFGLSFFTEDAREGIAAFLEKRTPDFQGK